ncbi:hypothetical protein LTR36_010755 [Oleoguttula mirabilis]|uniref:Uncharacterized protein n=1 Tax=Oleoguttula mirabilis TaxID=1507867 RepID=A0AAV9JRI4_9PEZI|nr:hypothetical protein LTR36_010755 [Oleoguttula mirabilis]
MPASWTFAPYNLGIPQDAGDEDEDKSAYPTGLPPPRQDSCRQAPDPRFYSSTHTTQRSRLIPPNKLSTGLYSLPASKLRYLHQLDHFWWDEGFDGSPGRKDELQD